VAVICSCSWASEVADDFSTRLSGSYHAFNFRKYAVRYMQPDISPRSPIDSAADSICAPCMRDASWQPPPARRNIG